MDIMQIWGSYQKGANPENIFPMYQECSLKEKATGYGDVNLLHIASQNAHPEAVAWLLEQGLKPNTASGYGDLPLFLLPKKGFPATIFQERGIPTGQHLLFLMGAASVSAGDSRGNSAIITPHRRVTWSSCAPCGRET